MAYLEEAFNLINILSDQGYKAYIIGGAVRDYLLGKEVYDIDITSNILPNELAAIFEVKNTGLKYNSVTVLFHGYEFEVTTFRRDIIYLDNRHPIYEVANSLEEDVKRRDYTINALAFSPDKKIIDFVDGKKDLDNRLLKAIGNPAIRFQEDSLRIIRGIHFAAKLDLMIEENTKQAMKDYAYLIQNLSFNRILEEIKKMISSKTYLISFKLMNDLRVVNYLNDFKDGIKLVLSNQVQNLTLLLFLLINYYKKDLTNLDIKERKQMEIVYSLMDKDLLNPRTHFDYELEYIIYANVLKKVFNLKPYNDSKLYDLNEKLPLRNMRQLEIDAEDIIRLKNKSGSEIKDALNQVIDAVLSKKVKNNREELFKYISKYIK